MKKRASLVALAFAALATPAQAMLVEWTWQADVQSIIGNVEGAEEFGIANGSVFWTTIVFDNDVSGIEHLNGYTFIDAVVSIDISGELFDASMHPNSADNVLDAYEHSVDQIITQSRVEMANGSANATGILSTQFIGSNGLLIDNVQNPWLPDFEHMDPYDPNHTTQSGSYLLLELSINGEIARIEAAINSPSAHVVPVPAAVWSMLSGLGVLLGLRSRK